MAMDHLLCQALFTLQSGVNAAANTTANSSITKAQVYATRLRGRCASGIQPQTAGQLDHLSFGSS